MYYYVYLLTNKENKHYVGCTNNIKNRLQRHNAGQVLTTKVNRPWRLKACFIFDNQHKAFKFEQYLKTGSGREFLKRHHVWD